MKFVTSNPNKVREAQSILGVELERVDLPIEEIQTCNVETAVRHKVEEAYAQLNSPVLVEDSGLIFEAWKGLPGALIKWFENTVGLDGLLRMLEGFPNRNARAVCLVAFHDGRKVYLGRGEVPGRIAQECRGRGGFGWDAIFIPEGQDRTFGEMTLRQKNALSHRRRALENLVISTIVEASD